MAAIYALALIAMSSIALRPPIEDRSVKGEQSAGKTFTTILCSDVYRRTRPSS
jgi:hypothetical protein